MELNRRLTDEQLESLLSDLEACGIYGRQVRALAELQERRSAEAEGKAEAGEHFKRGYDEGHSRGLTCGRLYKSDDQMVAHRAACVSEYKTEISGVAYDC